MQDQREASDFVLTPALVMAEADVDEDSDEERETKAEMEEEKEQLAMAAADEEQTELTDDMPIHNKTEHGESRCVRNVRGTCFQIWLHTVAL